MTKVISAVIGGLLLSGCALPVPIQIASWALDGLSLLTTNKSVTDHGISIVAKQDCALWRGVTEGSVCREDDPMAIIAEQGDVHDNSVGEGSSLVASFTSKPAASSSPALSSEEITHVSWVMEPETAPAVEAQIEVAQIDEPKVEETQTEEALVPKVQMVSQNVMPFPGEMDTYSAEPGNYFVIGSFGVPGNARRFADRYPVLNTQILTATVADEAVYRIVVGPYDRSNKTLLRLMIRNVGISDTWAVRVPADEITVAWQPSSDPVELAALPAAE